MITDKLQESCLSRGVQRCGYHICVLGVIASGKTTLTKALEEVIKEETGFCMAFYEPVSENPLLPLYYKNPERYAFPMQIYMLNRRLEQQRVAQVLATDGLSCVQDSSVFGDTCFVEMLHKDGLLNDEEVDVYSELFLNMSRDVMYPSMVVYLNCPAEKAMERLKKRSRECESGVPVEYLRKLKNELDILVADFGKYTFVKEINASIDLTEDEIKAQAREIFHDVQMTRNKPILSRMGV